MKVLIIPSWYPNGTDKLMGIYHKEFAEALSNNPDISEVNMLYIDRQRLNAPIKYIFMPKKELIKEKGYNVYITKMLDVHKISEAWQLKRYCHKLEQAFKEYLKTNDLPDIIHAEVSLPAGYATCKLGEKYHIPVVITEHASYFKRFFEGKNKEIGKYILENSTFTTVSNFMAKEMLKLTNSCEVLPNLVDTTCYKKDRKNIKDLKLVTVSALRQGKRIDDQIMALKIFQTKHPEIKSSLTIVGDGFIADYYHQKCHELGMDEYVNFVGRKNNKEEIAEILNEHNIFLISSEKETFCIPGIEALASGMPVISTKCLGPEEYLDNKCGKLVNVGAPEEMADAIYEVYQNLDQYDISYLRSIADKYSSSAITNQALKIYKTILTKNSSNSSN